MTVVARMTGRLLGRGATGLLALLLGVVLFEAVQAPVVNSFGGPRGLTSILDALPPTVRLLTRTRSELVPFSGLAGYLSLGFTHPLYLILTAATVVTFAARGLAGEMERGTIQLALSRPVSRPQVYGARVIGVVLLAIALAVIGPLGMIAGMLYARPEGEFVYRNLIPTAIGGALLFWAIGGATLLGSAAASTTGRVVGWAIAGLIVSYFVDYFSGIWDFLKPFEFLSIFDYYDPGGTLVFGTLPWTNVVTLGAVGLVGAVGGLAVFVRRDLPV